MLNNPHADPADRTQTVDYLRAVVPANVLLALLAIGLAVLWWTVRPHSWRDVAELAFLTWLLASSLVVVRKARTVLRQLESRKTPPRI